jgi:hypothetical protein
MKRLHEENAVFQKKKRHHGGGFRQIIQIEFSK